MYITTCAAGKAVSTARDQCKGLLIRGKMQVLTKVPCLPCRQAAWAKQDRLCCHSTSPESVLRRLEEIAPISIDDDVAVPALLVTIPVCLYIAFKILIWDYQVSLESSCSSQTGSG